MLDQAEPAAQTPLMMVRRAGRLMEAMQADRGINHVSSGQSGEVEVSNELCVGWSPGCGVGREASPPFLPLRSGLRLVFQLALFTSGCDMFAVARPVPPPSCLD